MYDVIIHLNDVSDTSMINFGFSSKNLWKNFHYFTEGVPLGGK